MGILGTLLLLFPDHAPGPFFVGTKVALYGGDQPHNLFEEMKEVFSQEWVVALYLVGIIALFWHLYHGFQSAFQTLGMNHKNTRLSSKRPEQVMR